MPSLHLFSKSSGTLFYINVLRGDGALEPFVVYKSATPEGLKFSRRVQITGSWDPE